MAALRRSHPVYSLLFLALLLRAWTVDWSLFDDKEIQGDISESPLAIFSKEQPIHLVYASDDGSIPGVEASIRSAICHASEPVVFHYIGNSPLESLPDVHYHNLTQISDKYRLKELTNPHERHDESLKGLNTNLANYARFVIHDLLPDQSKAMWVDADTLFRCDPVPMVRNALSNSPYVISAVPSSSVPRGFDKGLKKRLKIKVGFNAGVFVVDLDRWRSQNVTKKMREWTRRNRRKCLYKLGSQGPMTLVFHDNFEPLPYSWNTKVSHLEERDKRGNLQDACLLHWSGPNPKPWEENGYRKDLWVPCSNGASGS